MSRRRTFRYRAGKDRVFVTHIDRTTNHETDYVLCTVHKEDAPSWAMYIAERMELGESLMASGLKKEEIHALARMVYEHYRPEGGNS